MILAIYGTGGGGKETLQVAQDVMKKNSQWDDIVFIDDTKETTTFHGYECYPYSIFCEKYNPGNAKVHVALGEIGLRKMLIKIVEKDGFSLENIIHPTARIGNNVSFSDGIQVKMGTVIGDNVSIGKGTWIQAYAHIMNEVIIDDFCQISAKALIKENVKINPNGFVGMHGIVEKNLVIGKYGVVSMGAVVFNDVLDEQICMGNPARAVAINKEHRVFFKEGK